MGYITSFFKWLYDCLAWVTRMALTPFGAMITAISSAAGFFASVFSRLSVFQNVSSWVHDMTQSLSAILQYNIDGLGQVLLYAFGIDRLVQIASAAVALSFGVTVLVFITMFALVFALIPSILAVRAIMKTIQVATLGVADP